MAVMLADQASRAGDAETIEDHLRGRGEMVYAIGTVVSGNREVLI